MSVTKLTVTPLTNLHKIVFGGLPIKIGYFIKAECETFPRDHFDDVLNIIKFHHFPFKKCVTPLTENKGTLNF